VADATPGEPSEGLFTRDEALGGLPARRTRTLLFLVESRTAHLAARSREAMVPYHWEDRERERDAMFLEAFALGRDPPLRPTIQDLERQASGWAHLVPDDPEARAALAHELGEKYDLPAGFVPGIRAALGLDEPPVRSAYQRAYHRPLETLYAPRIRLVDRLRWGWTRLAAWLESLPPFWMAFALTLTETVGAGILALPIALAGVGPLVAVALLIVIGLINVVTIAALAEAVAHSASVRYGGAFFGRLVADYLGGTGSLILTIGVAVYSVLVLLVYYVGLSHALRDATSVPAQVWSALLFLVGVYFLSRESLRATVASALVVGVISIGLILVLSLIALAHLQPANLLYANLPLVHERPFDASILELAFGVVVMAYFGHLSVGNCARVVLRRDGSGRSLVWGAAAAQATAVGLYCFWILAINSAIGPEALVGQSGTALSPLAEVGGRGVHVLGAIFVVVAMGMGSVHLSLALFNLVRERLPLRGRREVKLDRTGAAPREDNPPARTGLEALLRRVRELNLDQRAQFLLSISPVVAIFVLAEWLFFTGSESFVGPASLAGVLAGSVIGGLFPMLLLISSEQKSDFILDVGLRLRRNPVIKTAIYLFFLAGLLLYGLVIWDGPVERAAALLVAGLVLSATVRMARQGAFAPRLVLRLWQDAGSRDRAEFAVVRGGRPATARVRLKYPDGEREVEAAGGEIPAFTALQTAAFELPTDDARELNVWIHRITADGDSEGLPAVVDVGDGHGTQRLDLTRSDGHVLLPIEGSACQLTVTFPTQSR